MTGTMRINQDIGVCFPFIGRFPSLVQPFDVDQLIQQQLANRAAEHRLRTRRIVHPVDAVRLRIDGQLFINFASNDYLGLTHHPTVHAAMRDAIAVYGAGSGAAGLISGYTDIHAAAEQKLASWKGAEAAILLPSGYQANHAAIQTLAAMGEAARGGVRFLLDKLLHASLIDAVRATGAPFRVFPHNHLPKLKRLLVDAEKDQLQIVVTESIFSMDGDAAAMIELAELKHAFGFLLLVDEAHATGVYGPRGNGYAAQAGLQATVDVSVVTFSKAMGLMGGAVCGSRSFCDMLINHARAYIYSTSIAPALAAGVIAAIDVMDHEPQQRERLRRLARRVRAELQECGMRIGGLDDSPILPVILGDEQSTLAAAEALRKEGILVAAVRPPTVAPGASRLRVTLSSRHEDDQIARLCKMLRDLHG